MIKRALLSLALILISSATAFAQDGDKVALRLYADQTAAVPGQPLHLAIEQSIADGWHTYWTNPGDSGEAMKIKWTLPQGAKASGFLWPTPEHIPYGPLMNFGYHERAVILTDIEVPLSAPIGSTFAVSGKASVLVCDEICVPETHDVVLNVPVAATASPANADLFAEAASHIPQPVDWTTVTEFDANEVRVRVTLPTTEAAFAADLDAVEWFPLEYGYVVNADDQIATYDSTTRTLTLRQTRDNTRDIKRLRDAQYLVVSGTRSVIIGGSMTAAAAPIMGQPSVVPAADLGLLTIMLFAFVGGVILNLMPCVFPVLSMKALHLVSLPKAERTHAQKSGALYALGIIAMFLALGGMLYTVREAGEQLGWGFQLQNPAVVAGIAWLLFVTGLNLAGVFNLRIAFGGEVLLAEKHHPLVTSFLSGVLATVVATPCSAPFMATAIGAALVEPMPIAMAIFAMVGFGLAFPYLLLCYVPRLQKILPRPGAWMETFRQILAFPMFASAVWLVWVVAQQGGPTAVAWTLAGMVSLAFAVWILGRQPKRRIWRRAMVVTGVAVLALTILGLNLVIPQGRNDAEVDAAAVNFKPYSSKAFEGALKGDAPVLVNMTASWCITCLVNEKVTLDTPEVIGLMKTQRVTYFKGDWTNKDPEISTFLQMYGRSGVPLYVYFGGPDDTGKRPPAVVLPQILSQQVMFDTIR